MKTIMNQANKERNKQMLVKSFEEHLNRYESLLTMKTVSIEQLMMQQKVLLELSTTYQEKGPKTIELNEVDDSNGTNGLVMRAITSTKNLGNTCYANSAIFYGMRFIPLFTEKLHNWLKKSVGKMPRKGKRMLEVFQMLHVEYMKMSGSERRNDLWSQFKASPELAIDPSAFLFVMRQLAPGFIEGEQHDAAEILMKLLEWLKYCSDILKEWANKNGLPADIEQTCFYDDYFMGKVLKIIKCLECGHIKDGSNLETSIISVPVPRDMVDMNVYDWILENLFRANEQNEYNCENCQAQPRPKALIHNSYELLPRLLILQMEYEVDVLRNGFFKAKGLVPLPMELQCFCVRCKDDEPNENHKYHLNSIVVHIGVNFEGGHYITFVRHLNPGGNNESCCQIKLNAGAIRGKNIREIWLKCDDANITVISQNDMDNILRNEITKPHLVFYARNDIVAEV